MNGLSSAHQSLGPADPNAVSATADTKLFDRCQQQHERSINDPPSYVQRLNVQLPMTMKADQAAELQQSGDDVLRLVIHVEGDDEHEEVVGGTTRHSLRRKVSWHSEESAVQPDCRPGGRRLLKQIGRQRSASLEAPPCARLLSVPVGTSNDEHDHAGRRSVNSCPEERDAQQQQSTITSSSSHTVVKEFRRSSELLRNILFSLSSRRSSDSSANSSNRESSVNLVLPGGVGAGPSSLLAEAPDLQVALQAHRKRRWVAVAADTSPDLTSAGHQPDSTTSQSAALFEAISSGNLTRTRQLLDNGIDPNICHSSGYTVLHWCAVQTPVPWPLLLELLEHGCRIEQRDKDGTQPVFLLPNLPRIQQQLVRDAVDYLRRPPAETEPREEDSSHHGMDGAGGGGGSSGVNAQRAAGNLFRRFQQSAGARMKQPAHSGNPGQSSTSSKHGNKGGKELEFPSECDSRNGFEITSIKV